MCCLYYRPLTGVYLAFLRYLTLGQVLEGKVVGTTLPCTLPEEVSKLLRYCLAGASCRLLTHLTWEGATRS